MFGGHMAKRKYPTYQMLAVIGCIYNSANSNNGMGVWGLEIMQKVGTLSGTIYPILSKFEELGFVKKRKEKGDPVKLERPLRSYYRLTAKGLRFARRYKAGTIASNPPLVQLEDFV